MSADNFLAFYQIKCLKLASSDMNSVISDSSYSSSLGQCCNKCELCSRNAIGYIDREGRVILTAPLPPGDFLRTLHLSPSNGQKLPTSSDWSTINPLVVQEEAQDTEVEERSDLMDDSSDTLAVQNIDGNHDFDSHLDEISCGLQGETLFLANATFQLLAEEAKMAPSSERVELIEHVITTTVEAHMNTCNYTLEKVTEGLRRYHEMMATQSSVRCSILDDIKHPFVSK